MPGVGNDKNATVERGKFSAAQNALIGPSGKWQVHRSKSIRWSLRRVGSNPRVARPRLNSPPMGHSETLPSVVGYAAPAPHYDGTPENKCVGWLLSLGQVGCQMYSI